MFRRWEVPRVVRDPVGFSLAASAETKTARRGRGKLQRSAEAKKGFQRDCAQRIVPKGMDEQKPHRNHPRAGLSPFNGVFADKGAICGRAEPSDEAEQKQQGPRTAFKERLEPIVVGAVDEVGYKIRHSFVKRIHARKGA